MTPNEIQTPRTRYNLRKQQPYQNETWYYTFEKEDQGK